jgi:hypothetical protein
VTETSNNFGDISAIDAESIINTFVSGFEFKTPSITIQQQVANLLQTNPIMLHELKLLREDLKKDSEAQRKDSEALRKDTEPLRKGIEELQKKTTFEYQSNQRVLNNTDTVYFLPLSDGTPIEDFDGYMHLASFKALSPTQITNLLATYNISGPTNESVKIKLQRLAHYLGIRHTAL